jgi:NAD-dependent SIR2 family protein deacetylase
MTASTDQRLEQLAGLLAAGSVAVLSGAGLSTESGIPDYRGPSGSLRRHTPMTYQEFTSDPAARRRYWARSHLGWHTITRACPNDGHRAVAELQAAGLVDAVVTQNVDGLQQAAGARQVVELHGGLDRVVCLACGRRSSRRELAARLAQANPDFEADVAHVNPDGDAQLDDTDGFVVVDCLACGGGPLKPDVVFFGECVPKDRVQHSFSLLDAAHCLLVLGSSLTVMSGYRFVLRAARAGTPVAIVNLGATRGDGHAGVKVEAPLGQVLPELVERLRPMRLQAGQPA